MTSSPSHTKQIAQLVAFDHRLHSKRGHELYDESFEHAERYRLIIAGKTGAEREHRRLMPIIRTLAAEVERLRGALETARDEIHMEFCGEVCHSVCLAPTQVLTAHDAAMAELTKEVK